MTKAFFEVFPEFQVNGALHTLLQQAQVSRVSMNQRRDRIRIYLDSETLITHDQIAEVEKALKTQFFRQDPIEISLIERFRLSELYTPQNLLPMYEESLLSELKEKNAILHHLYRQAEKEFSAPDTMILRLDKNIVSGGKEQELQQYLEKVFCERCGLSFHLQILLEEPPREESRFSALHRRELEQEIAGISRSYYAAKGAGSTEDSGEETFIRPDPAKNVPSESTNPSVWENSQYAAENSSAGKAGKENLSGKEDAAASGMRKGEDLEKKRRSFLTSRHSGSPRHSDNPDVIYGKDFAGEVLELVRIDGEIGEVVVRGQMVSLDRREVRNDKTMILFNLTDFTDTIAAKLFVRTDQSEELLKELKIGSFYQIRAVAAVDHFDGQLALANISGIKKTQDFRPAREDRALVKRVELHCHTKMSDMDGVSDVKDIVSRAISWGQKAIAITDHGVVQAFPDAAHAIPRGSDFKVIYGMEGYLVDDLKKIVENPGDLDLSASYVVFDLETTGFSAEKNQIIEIGAVKVEHGRITDRFSTFVNPGVPIPFRITELTSINDAMVLDAPVITEVLPAFLKFCQGCVMVAHNASFDMSFVSEAAARMQLSCPAAVIDTVAMARVLLPGLGRYKLDTVAKALNVSLDHHHRAVDDAACTAEIFVKFLKMLEERDLKTWQEVNEYGKASPDQIRKMPTYHVILLAKNEIGRINLYRLVSWSHIDYYSRHPRIPKSVLQECREGLLIGSACEAGELYQALLRGVPEHELTRLAEFYDYLEIQPLGNNEFMTREDAENPRTLEELQDLNRRIIRLGEQLHKPVVGTCDVHFLNPEDEVYRRIIMASKGFKDADSQAPLYLRTTEEMLAEFSYLGEEKAYEIVVENTNRIAAMCDRIDPVRPDKCAPVIDHSDQILRKLCYDKAHEIYGEELPEVVSERLERELHSIISNGFAVMYIIAQKLVWKSNADGYLVGSRGSVGSSLVATMSGITEVNPLRPHYYCASCHYSDFDSEAVKAYAGRSGCDMPDRICPRCGENLKKEGFDIPFETFLGFKGNKEPDIDLNFSGEYQSKAHRYTEVIFGSGQTYRAGTIGTLADKTAFGFVKHYYEERGIHKRNCEINRIVQGCVGVRRTTGQHPGGIIVLPVGEEIYSFTPVQHPANDMTTDIVTTHFDYHSIDHNLLKLDILGHDDPTMIRMLEDLTGINAREIPLDDKGVMSLFSGTQALGITPEDIGGCPLGSLGIPEFGTDFAMQMLIDTKPQSFSDLVRIAGLAHGTDVWLGNAQTLILEGKATISTAICTRDDIMIYLIGKGMDSELSFTIMESVRKGKGLKPEWEEYMLAHDVPDWYIWSCKKIKYMFPKAHAAAYVMMAWRIAYCKINYPLAYYAAFFSIRASAFDYEIMCQGSNHLQQVISDYERRSDSLSKKEEDTMRDMKLVREMYARGFTFLPIDIYRSQATRFQIVDGKLLPALSTISGLGEKAAEAIVDAVKDGPFLSRDDFRNRTKVSKTVTDLMCDLGILKGLPETNQLSLFDLVS